MNGEIASPARPMPRTSFPAMTRFAEPCEIRKVFINDCDDQFR